MSHSWNTLQSGGAARAAARAATAQVAPSPTCCSMVRLFFFVFYKFCLQLLCTNSTPRQKWIPGTFWHPPLRPPSTHAGAAPLAGYGAYFASDGFNLLVGSLVCSRPDWASAWRDADCSLFSTPLLPPKGVGLWNALPDEERSRRTVHQVGVKVGCCTCGVGAPGRRAPISSFDRSDAQSHHPPPAPPSTPPLRSSSWCWRCARGSWSGGVEPS